MFTAELKLSVERWNETGVNVRRNLSRRIDSRNTRRALQAYASMEPVVRLVDTAVSQYEGNSVAHVE